MQPSAFYWRAADCKRFYIWLRTRVNYRCFFNLRTAPFKIKNLMELGPFQSPGEKGSEALPVCSRNKMFELLPYKWFFLFTTLRQNSYLLRLITLKKEKPPALAKAAPADPVPLAFPRLDGGRPAGCDPPRFLTSGCEAAGLGALSKGGVFFCR